MKLDHTPSGIKTRTFNEWLDYCVLGAEEMGRLLSLIHILQGAPRLRRPDLPAGAARR